MNRRALAHLFTSMFDVKRSMFDVQGGLVPAAAGKSEGRHCSKKGEGTVSRRPVWTERAFTGGLRSAACSAAARGMEALLHAGRSSSCEEKSSAPHPAEPELPWARAELRALRGACLSSGIKESGQNHGWPSDEFHRRLDAGWR
jgi:hypothetical protein